MERKRLQIEHAPHASYKAKLIKLADKLYNLRDLKRCTPKGWSKDRVQEYFVFAFDVVAGLRGINDPMERELDKYSQTLIVLVQKWPKTLQGRHKTLELVELAETHIILLLPKES
jgi:guanosine-3',5'-bis(diphosphate) 3'-pyrophosphohydrolase